MTKKITERDEDLPSPGLDAVFKKRYGVESSEFYARLSRLVRIKRFGHVLAACASPSGGYKPPKAREAIIRRLSQKKRGAPKIYVCSKNGQAVR